MFYKKFTHNLINAIPRSLGDLLSRRAGLFCVFLMLCVVLLSPKVLFADLVVPADSTLEIGSGILNTTGDVINDGTIVTTTGTLDFTNDWDMNTGTYIPGIDGTLIFSGSTIQNFDSAGVTLNNVVHSGTGRVEVNNSGLAINGDFTNSAGIVDLNSNNVVIAGDWDNSVGITGLIATGSEVTFNGTIQTIRGVTRFYSLTKEDDGTLILEANQEQEISSGGTLTLRGVGVGDELTLTSTNPGGGLVNRHQILLESGALQDLEFLDVSNSDATGLNLVARNSLDTDNTDSAEADPKWYFGGALLTWTGSANVNWNNPANWDLGIVPTADDSVVIPDVSGASGNFPTLASITGAGITVTNLTIDVGAQFSAGGKNVNISEDLDNNGTINAYGYEVFVLSGANDTTSGTWVLTGDTDNLNENFVFTSAFPLEYFNLTINDPALSDNFITDADITVLGDFTVTAGTFNNTTNNNTVNIIGDYYVNGATAVVLGSGGSFDVNGDFQLSAGTFTAPGSAQSFTISGDFRQSGGTFTHSSGTVVLDGADQLVSGSGTVFYNLSKVASEDTLTFDHTVAQVSAPQIIGTLTLNGVDATHPLTIDSTVAGSEAFIDLRPGGAQDLLYILVKDSNAQPQGDSLTLVGRESSEPAVNPNNTNWFFGSLFVTWQGGFGSSQTDWNTPQNWDLGLVPYIGDTVVIPDTANDPILATDVDIDNLTIEANAVVDFNGHGMEVDTAFSNEGTVYLRGTETVSLTQDIDSGLWVYTGDNTGTPILIKDFGAVDYFDLTINDQGAVSDSFITNDALNVDRNLTVSAGLLNTATNTPDLGVANNLTIDGGALVVATSNVDINASLIISSGSMTAPEASYSFTIAENWTHSGGTFDANGGTVTFDTASTAVISGDTDFESVSSSVAGKTIQFTAGSTQTIYGTISLIAAIGNEMVLESTSAGNPWNLISPNGSQFNLQFLSVQDSEILGDAGDDFYCFYCTNAGNNDQVNIIPQWVFSLLEINSPEDGKTVDQTPTIMGVSNPGDVVDIYANRASDGALVLVATVTANVNGNWRVEVDDIDATRLQIGNNILQPGFGAIMGVPINIEVVAAPTTDQQPVITSPLDGLVIFSDSPMIEGQGLAGAAIVVYASDSDGDLLLQNVGSGVIDGSGNYVINLSKTLVGGVNYLSVTVDGVTSNIIDVIVSNPGGIVFDSVYNNPVNKAQVSLIRSADNQLAQPGVDILAGTINPFITEADGIYAFSARDGDYYIQIIAEGYEYPSQIETFPSGRIITTGSLGEVFTVGASMSQIDQPLDQGTGLVRVEKNANKPSARTGEVVTYTVTMENLNAYNNLDDLVLRDNIPAGFKYLNERVILEGVPVADPTGNRSLSFNVGSLAGGQTKTLKYQLIIGSGVTMGTYGNKAFVMNSGDLVISNVATEEVDIVADPLFDMGSVIGKVFHDVNENGRQDNPEYVQMDRDEIIEEPLPNIKLVMADGTEITTDDQGMFSIPGLVPGRHLLRLDERSLPDNAYLTTDKAVVIDVTPGLLVKVNFGVNFDYGRMDSQDEMFFAKNVTLNLDDRSPEPRLNVQMFEEEILTLDGHFTDNAQFRIFLNYASFVELWRLEIFDPDTQRVVRKFEGNRYNINDLILWDGKNNAGNHVNVNRTYQYRVFVEDGKNHFDETEPQPINLVNFDDENDLEDYLEDNNRTVKNYQEWVKREDKVNRLKIQNILVQGETLRIRQVATNLQRLQVMRDGELVIDVPISPEVKVTARDILEERPEDDSDEIEVILPKGEYQIFVQEARTNDSRGSAVSGTPVFGNTALINDKSNVEEIIAGGGKSFAKNIRIGEDYLFFVGLGDIKAGYNFNRGQMESVTQDDRYQDGFWKEDKASYFLKGKILGKFLVSSSYDSEREQKEIFRKLDPDQYYPIYGDESSVNYEVTDTQGRLYLLVEWDKSSARWSNYNINFGDTEFAQYSRSLFGGKLDYQSVDTTKFGDAKLKAIVFNAKANQKSAHNEFLATGGSIYYLKHDNVLQGSDQIKVEVRDQVTGLVVSKRDLVEGVDYELDYGNGRVIFWQPIPVLVETLSIVSSNLLSGNPVYVVADYEYEVQDDFAQSSYGARVQQALTDNVLVGGTYVHDGQENEEYQLQGMDVTLKLAKDNTIIGEFAETNSSSEGAFVSTDGGITFTEVSANDDVATQAYGLKGDFRLFNRLGIKNYYKWIENDFSTSATSAQQGKELIGFEVVYDFSENTRMSGRYDIQELISGGSAQTRMQLGAVKTTTSMMQILHEADRWKFTAEYQRTEVQQRLDSFDNQNNTETDLIGVKAEYEVSEKLSVSAGQQYSLTDSDKSVTRLGVTGRPMEGVTLTADQAFGAQGTATELGARADLTERLELSGSYSMASPRSGEKTSYGSVGAKLEVNDQMKLKTSFGTDGERETIVTAGGSKKMGETGILDAQVESVNSLEGTETEVSLGGKEQVDEATTKEGKVIVTDRVSGEQNTAVTFGTRKKMTDELEFVSSQTFGLLSEGSNSQDHKYALIRNKDGRKLEGSYARETSEKESEISQSNIFGLSGDIDDRWAMNAQYQRSKVENLDGSSLTRHVASMGIGYRNEDKETGQDLKASTKLEYRVDSGATDRRQYLIYQSIEGKINPEISLFAKVDFSRTRNLTDNFTEASHREIQFGGAYRPIYHDRLNLIAKYTYAENQSPFGQESLVDDIEKTRMQVLALEGVYELNKDWQVVEKLASRILDEQVAGFPFNRTHTWLMIHRLNYRVNKDWTIGAEYRQLTQREAQDSKKGVLVEAQRNLGEFAELGVGYNFTDFSDDLTNLDYRSEGPFIRFTGKMYDRTPAEIERAEKRILDNKVSRWAWMMVNQELSRENSAILAELNDYYVLAQLAFDKGDAEEAHQIYKDIIVAGQMMLEDARQYIYSRIDREEELRKNRQLADEYMRNGQFEKARKILEKIIEDAQAGVLE